MILLTQGLVELRIRRVYMPRACYANFPRNDFSQVREMEVLRTTAQIYRFHNTSPSRKR